MSEYLDVVIVRCRNDNGVHVGVADELLVIRVNADAVQIARLQKALPACQPAALVSVGQSRHFGGGQEVKVPEAGKT